MSKIDRNPDSILDRDTPAPAPFGLINSRPKTKYEFLLEKELDARKTRRWFTLGLLAVVIVQSAIIAGLVWL